MTILRVRFQFCASDLYMDWTDELAAPAVGTRLFEDQVFSDDYSEATMRAEGVVLRLVLSSLGAVKLTKSDLQFWSLGSESFEAEIKSMLEKMPLSEQKARGLMLQSFPLCSAEEHRAILRSYASFDSAKKRWTLLKVSK